MADSAAVLEGISRREGVSYPVLTPNLQGETTSSRVAANDNDNG